MEAFLGKAPGEALSKGMKGKISGGGLESKWSSSGGCKEESHIWTGDSKIQRFYVKRSCLSTVSVEIQ